MILTEEIENSLKNEAEIDDLLKQIHDMDFCEYIHHLFEIIENIVILEISNLENGLWVENEKYILDCYNEEK